MSVDPDTTRVVRSWMDEGVTQLPDRVLDAVLDQLPATPQRRAGWPARRSPIMNKILGFGLVAAAIIAAVLIGSQLFGSPSNVGGPGTESSPSPTAEPTATAAASAAEPTSTPESDLPEGPFALPTEEGLPAITVVIPAAGWEFVPDFTSLTKGDEVDNLPEAAILFWGWDAGTGFYVPGDPCQFRTTKPEAAATTVEEIAARLAAQVSRDASEPVDVTVDGHAGKALSLHVPEDAVFEDCEGGEFVSYGTERDELERYHQGPGQIDDLVILDVDGSIVIMDAMYRPDTSPALVDEMRSILESATFETP